MITSTHKSELKLWQNVGTLKNSIILEDLNDLVISYFQSI